MMNYLFAIMISVSVIFGIVSGRGSDVSNAVFVGISDAVELSITLLGIISFWSGIMKIAEKSGVTKFFGKILSPVVSLIFKDIPKDSKASEAISMNMVANLFGLGNAATPLGIIAMKEMHELNNKSPVASKSMIMFVVLNTASLQLVPTTIGALRASAGAKNPMDIMTSIWFASVISVISGVMVAKIFERSKKYE